MKKKMEIAILDPVERVAVGDWARCVIDCASRSVIDSWK